MQIARFTNPAGWRRGRLAILVLGLAGPVLAVFVERFARAGEQQHIQARFDDLAMELAADIEREFVTCAEQLHSLRALFDSSTRVERAEFETFTCTTRDRHPAVLACEWAPRVPAGQRASFEKALAEEESATFRIRALLDDRLTTATETVDHYPVLYVEPLPGNEAVLGLDLASEPVRRRAIERAIATGQLTVSDPIDLVQGGESSIGALAILTVTEPDSGAMATGPGAIRGLVLLVFRYADLLESVLRADDRYSPESLAMQLVQTDASTRHGVLWSRPSRPPAGFDEAWTWHRAFSIGGRAWRLQARPTPAFLRRHRSSVPLLWGLTVLLTVTLVFGGLLTIARFSESRILQERERVLRSVLRSLNEGVIVADRNGYIRLFNETAQSLLGAHAGELASDWAMASECRKADGVTPFGPGEFPLIRAMQGERIRLENVHVRSEFAPEGRWLSVSGGPLIDEKGTPGGGVIAFRDITSRKESEARIRHLSNAVEQTADHILITDRAGRILYVNPAFETVTGFQADEVLGKTPRVLRSGAQDAEFYRTMWRTILSGRPFQSTTINRKKSGELYYAEQTITPMRDESGKVTHFVAVCKDMTERRQREKQDLELELAASVQGRLYPQAPPQLAWLEVDAVCRPASMTCGDYYDFIEQPDGSLCIAIGDVCGHGLGPALIMAATRAYLRTLLQSGIELAAVMTRLNMALIEDLKDEHFVTLLLVRIEARDRKLTYVNAGHPAAVVCDAQGQARHHLENTGIALGLSADAHYECPACLYLGPGEQVLMVTDGVLEARSADGSHFTMPRLLEVVRQHRRAPAGEALRQLARSLDDFAHRAAPEDDQTLVLCRLKP